MHYVYVLKSQVTNLLYFGCTSDLKQRLDEHNKGENFSTKSGKPWNLVYYEAYLSKSDASIREKQLKNFKSAYGFLKRRIKHSLSGT